MNDELDPLAAERHFFNALLEADVQRLDRLLADDFVLIDVLSGGENSKTALLAAVGAGQVRFEAIEPTAEPRVRIYEGTTAVVGGRTRMTGRLGDTAFTVASRYTHVYTRQQGRWRLVSAQGTPIAGG
jgi:ketosteroid isomerase-like protein